MVSLMQAKLFFSIIIPTYNRPQQLTTCLESLTRLDYPRKHFEVILVDDGSETPLAPVVAGFQNQLNLKLLRQSNAGPAAARNTGARQALGEFLVFTDDDCAPAPNWLNTLAARFAVAPDRIIGGKTLNALPGNIFSTTSQLIVDVVYAHYNANPEQARFFASNNLALSAEKFQALGGFDPNFHTSEDREFCDRWLYHGHQMLYASDVQIYHAHKMTLRSFWRQHFGYGRGAFRFHQIRFRRGLGQIKVEPEFYIKLLTYPFVLTSTSQPRLLLALLFILSQVASTVGFFWERFNSLTAPVNSLEKTS
jgi:GT2 family glycosyltransferase